MKISLNKSELSKNRVATDFLKNLEHIFSEGVSDKYKNFVNMLMSRGKASMEFRVFNKFSAEVAAFAEDMKEFLCTYAQSKKIDEVYLVFDIPTGIGPVNVAVQIAFDSSYRGGFVSIDNLSHIGNVLPIFMCDFDLWD